MPHAPQPYTAHQSGPLRGTITVPGDKSISHRAIMLGGIASGVTQVRGLLEGEDVLRTIAALKELGASVEKNGDVWHITGTGNVLREPSAVLDMGNSGTAARLLMGLLATRPFTSLFTGDASLVKRPMKRVITPLQHMGAQFMNREGGRFPLAMSGAAQPVPVTYRLPVASAQVKSAVLLAGLNATGPTTVIETTPTRDHSERMLRSFGAKISITRTSDGAEAITLTGPAQLTGREVVVPSDISSASFPLVAALLRSDSEVVLPHVGLNPRRTGLLESLREMGANIAILNPREESGEPVGDIVARTSSLKAVTVPADRAPSMIDEYPILAMAAACADGTTRLCGLGELRVKESDRLALVAEGLKACGANVMIEGDDLIITGNGKPPAGGARIKTALDHRIAMSFLVLGGATPNAITIDDGGMIATSFPGFVTLMTSLGANITLS